MPAVRSLPTVQVDQPNVSSANIARSRPPQTRLPSTRKRMGLVTTFVRTNVESVAPQLTHTVCECGSLGSTDR